MFMVWGFYWSRNGETLNFLVKASGRKRRKECWCKDAKDGIGQMVHVGMWYSNEQGEMR